MKIGYFFLCFLVGALSLPQALAGTQYLTGPPEISAAISGTNEFVPGDTVPIPVVVQNKGLIQLKLIRPDLVSPDYFPNTAMLMKVGLGKGDAPLSVKSEPQMIGDIPGDTVRVVPFTVQINQDAIAGTYHIPVTLEYTFLWSAASEGQDNIAYYFKTEQKEQDLTIVIRPIVILNVVEVSVKYLNAGTEGYLNLTLMNTGSEHARETVLHIAPTGLTNPLQPTDSSAFIGEFPPGGIVQSSFRVSASSAAEVRKTYPFTVSCEYVNFEGKTTESDQVTFGVPVGGKIQFTMVFPAPEIHPGEQKAIEVMYQNNGPEAIREAQVRLSTVDPFTGTEDTAYLGSLAPGEAAIARFEVTLDSAATVKDYGLDSEIRYRDTLDNTLISETIKVPIKVSAPGSILGSYGGLLAISIIVMVVLGGVYVWRTRKKPR